MHYFLDTEFDPDRGLLSAEESRHAMKSMRLEVGDTLRVGDGKGTAYVAEITGMSDRRLTLRVLDVQREPQPQHTLTVAMALPKNPSRFEWFLEKATELGVDHIVPLRTRRTVRPHLKYNRALRVLTAATKQSQRLHIPRLSEMCDLDEVLKEFEGRGFVAHCREDLDRQPIGRILPQVKGDIGLLIGPEGDFTEGEIREAEEAGFSSIDLGSRRLRTETAAVFATGLLKWAQENET